MSLKKRHILTNLADFKLSLKTGISFSMKAFSSALITSLVSTKTAPNSKQQNQGNSFYLN